MIIREQYRNLGKYSSIAEYSWDKLDGIMTYDISWTVCTSKLISIKPCFGKFMQKLNVDMYQSKIYIFLTIGNIVSY